MELSVWHVERALLLDPFDEEAARDRMGARPRPVRPVRPWRDGAVLVLLYPREDELHLCLTRRTDRVEYHRGQLSLPGGAREDGETLERTALRESEEEVGVDPARVRLLGSLPPLRIPPSGFIVTPFVGHLATRPEFRADPREVAGVLEVPFRFLLEPDRRAETERTVQGMKMKVPYFDLPEVADPPLWGATAMMLAGLAARVETVIDRNGQAHST